MFDTIANIVGLPVDQIRMVSGFLISVPIGLVYQNIDGRTPRVAVGTVVGLLLTYMVYQELILSVLIQAIIVYGLAATLKSKCAIPIFIETLIFVSAHHLYRQITDYGGWKLDITTILMMDTCKWTSFGWCIADGFKDEAKLSADQKIRKIKQLPSFVDYFGFIFFYAGCLAGVIESHKLQPAYDYLEYDEFMDQRGVYAELKQKKQLLGTPIIKETLRLLRNALITTVFMLIGTAYFPLEHLITQEFANYNWFYKTLWLNVMVTLLRAKYLSGWSFSEASIASSGFTFNGFKEGQPQFQRIKSIDIEVDKTYNINEKAKMWNISVQRWLGRYVYQRVHDEQSLKGSAKKQNDAQMITYLISAFWHGFYPGYYSSFLQWGIMAVNAKYFYKASLNLRVFDIFDNNKLFWVLRYYWVNTVFNSVGCGFLLLSLNNNLNLFNQLYWFPTLATLLVYGFFTVTQFGQRKPKEN